MNEVGGDSLEHVQADVESPATKIDKKVVDVRRSIRKWADESFDRIMQCKPVLQAIRKR